LAIASLSLLLSDIVSLLTPATPARSSRWIGLGTLGRRR
jgi:hypothetical protein